MPNDARSKMEGAFGADFGRVRIHEGSEAAELNDRIQAKAFTVGSDMYFRDGMPDTSSSSGQELMAHELTHVVQQGAVAARSLSTVRRQITGGTQGAAVNETATGELFTIVEVPTQADGNFTLRSSTDPNRTIEVRGSTTEFSLLRVEWPADLLRKNPLSRLPDPQAVRANYASVMKSLGVNDKTNTLKALEIVRNPVHKTVNGKDLIEYEALDPALDVGGSVDLDTLPKRMETDANYEAAFSKFYGVAAQNTGENSSTLSLNTNMAKYVDMIHEFAHGYETDSLPWHLREGLSEVFASMVADMMSISYVFNPAYATAAAGVLELIDVLGRKTLASYFFEDNTALRSALRDRKLDERWISVILSPAGLKLPDEWPEAMKALQTAGAAGDTMLPNGDDSDPDTAKAAFDHWLQSESDLRGIKADAATSPRELAQQIYDASVADTVERRLWLLYRHQAAIGTSNAVWKEQVEMFITGHEAALEALRGAKPDELRSRLLSTRQIR